MLDVEGPSNGRTIFVTLSPADRVDAGAQSRRAGPTVPAGSARFTIHAQEHPPFDTAMGESDKPMPRLVYGSHEMVIQPRTSAPKSHASSRE